MHFVMYMLPCTQGALMMITLFPVVCFLVTPSASEWPGDSQEADGGPQGRELVCDDRCRLGLDLY